MEKRSQERIPSIEIYTDGSLKKTGNMTFGGWSFIVVKNNEAIYFDTDSEYNTTNQRMELKAILKALNYIKDNRRMCERVIVYSDSAYAINCYLKEWYINWQRNGWLNANKQEVANKDLWFEIIPFFENFWYDFRKVKGHAGEVWNEKCDKIAQDSAEKLKRRWRGTKNI